MKFPTPAPPLVITNPANSISSSSAFVGGIADINNGGSTITQKGVVYSSFDHTPALYTDMSSFSGSGEGNYNCFLSNLIANTTYYYRAFATNSLGITVYGNVLSFQTSP